MAYGLSNGHVTDDVTWSQRCCEAVRAAILATTWLLVKPDRVLLFYTLVDSCSGYSQVYWKWRRCTVCVFLQHGNNSWQTLLQIIPTR